MRMAKKSKQIACEGCGKKLSKSGYYKHRKKCPDYIALTDSTPKITPMASSEPVQFSEAPQESPTPLESTEGDLSGDSENIPLEGDEPERPDWFDFDTEEEEGATEHFPSALKMAAGSGGMGDIGRNPTKAQIEAMHNTNLNILILSLGGVDKILETYGRAVTLQKDLVVKHSNSDKEMVAHAQYNWLLEKGINPSKFVSTGTIAAAMTGYFIIPPVLKIRKKAKVGIFKGGGFRRILSKIPLIGRFFKKKKTVPRAVMEEQVHHE